MVGVAGAVGWAVGLASGVALATGAAGDGTGVAVDVTAGAACGAVALGVSVVWSMAALFARPPWPCTSVVGSQESETPTAAMSTMTVVATRVQP